jgi:hypothetical protein
MILKAFFTEYSQQHILILVLTALLVSCKNDKKQNEFLRQAFQIHQEAVAIRNQTDAQLTKFIANEDSLLVNTYKMELESIGKALNTWDDQLVEVPGFEEEHDHAAHDHHHHEESDLTPEQHLQVQQHLLKEIRAIEKRIGEIIQQ